MGARPNKDRKVPKGIPGLQAKMVCQENKVPRAMLAPLAHRVHKAIWAPLARKVMLVHKVQPGQKATKEIPVCQEAHWAGWNQWPQKTDLACVWKYSSMGLWEMMDPKHST